MFKNQHIQKARKFIFEDLWELDFNALSFIKKIFFGLIKIVFIVVRGFSRDKCPLHSSALTYISLMSMVPLVALMLSVAKGFGAGERLNAIIAEQTAQLPENVTDFINKMLGYVENTNFGVLGAAGVALLFYTVIIMMGKIERSFNSIWGIHLERTFFRKFSDYLSILLVVPVLILAAASLNASLNANTFLLYLQETVPYFATIYQSLAKFTGTMAIWIAFTFIYIFMPNTNVRFVSALTGGIVAGTLWQWLQWASIHLQIGVAKYNAIYGTFSSVPIFLAWLYLCWLIVLLGCEVCFAVQNFKTFEEESIALKANQSTRESLAIALLTHMARNFQAGGGPWNVEEYASQFRIPIRLVRDVVRQLIESKIILRASEKPSGIVPGLPLEALKIKDILTSMRGVTTMSVMKKINPLHYNGETTLKELAETKEENHND